MKPLFFFKDLLEIKCGRYTFSSRCVFENKTYVFNHLVCIFARASYSSGMSVNMWQSVSFYSAKVFVQGCLCSYKATHCVTKKTHASEMTAKTWLQSHLANIQFFYQAACLLLIKSNWRKPLPAWREREIEWGGGVGEGAERERDRERERRQASKKGG